MIDHEFSTYFMFPDSMPRQMYWFEQLARSIQGDEVQRGEFDYLTKETERHLMEKVRHVCTKIWYTSENIIRRSAPHFWKT